VLEYIYHFSRHITDIVTVFGKSVCDPFVFIVTNIVIVLSLFPTTLVPLVDIAVFIVLHVHAQENF